MKKLIITETGKRNQQSANMKLGWLIGTISGVIKWNDDLSPDTRKLLFNELMSVLDPKGDALLIEHITRSMNERGFNQYCHDRTLAMLTLRWRSSRACLRIAQSAST